MVFIMRKNGKPRDNANLADVVVIGGGIQGSEIVRKLLSTPDTQNVKLIDQSSKLFNGASKAMARRISDGGHYPDCATRDYFKLGLKEFKRVWKDDSVVFGGYNFDDTKSLLSGKKVKTDDDECYYVVLKEDISLYSPEDLVAVYSTSLSSWASEKLKKMPECVKIVDTSNSDENDHNKYHTRNEGPVSLYFSLDEGMLGLEDEANQLFDSDNKVHMKIKIDSEASTLEEFKDSLIKELIDTKWNAAREVSTIELPLHRDCSELENDANKLLREYKNQRVLTDSEVDDLLESSPNLFNKEDVYKVLRSPEDGVLKLDKLIEKYNDHFSNMEKQGKLNISLQHWVHSIKPVTAFIIGQPDSSVDRRVHANATLKAIVKSAFRDFVYSLKSNDQDSSSYQTKKDITGFLDKISGNGFEELIADTAEQLMETVPSTDVDHEPNNSDLLCEGFKLIFGLKYDSKTKTTEPTINACKQVIISAYEGIDRIAHNSDLSSKWIPSDNSTSSDKRALNSSDYSDITDTDTIEGSYDTDRDSCDEQPSSGNNSFSTPKNSKKNSSYQENRTPESTTTDKEIYSPPQRNFPPMEGVRNTISDSEYSNNDSSSTDPQSPSSHDEVSSEISSSTQDNSLEPQTKDLIWSLHTKNDRRKFAVLLQTGRRQSVTFVQGPHSSCLKKFCTAEFVTNANLGDSPWDQSIKLMMDSINIENSYKLSNMNFIRTWSAIYSDIILFRRTPVIPDITKRGKDDNSSPSLQMSGSLKLQRDHIDKNFSGLNKHIDMRLIQMYWAMIISDFFSLIYEIDQNIEIDASERFSHIPDKFKTEASRGVHSIDYPYLCKFTHKPTKEWILRYADYIHLIMSDITDETLMSFSKNVVDSLFDVVFIEVKDNTMSDDELSKADDELSKADDELRDASYELRAATITDFINDERIPEDMKHTIKYFSGINGTIKHNEKHNLYIKKVFDTVFGLRISQAASTFIPDISHSVFQSDKPGHNEDSIRLFDILFYELNKIHALRDASHLNRINNFGFDKVLYGAVIRPISNGESGSAAEWISSKDSSAHKCNLEEPGEPSLGAITVPCYKFWHASINADKALAASEKHKEYQSVLTKMLPGFVDNIVNTHFLVPPTSLLVRIMQNRIFSYFYGRSDGFITGKPLIDIISHQIDNFINVFLNYSNVLIDFRDFCESRSKARSNYSNVLDEFRLVDKARSSSSFDKGDTSNSPHSNIAISQSPSRTYKRADSADNVNNRYNH
tara:strand:+ start:2582 stop:6322 length:3741 start_codon:yes stop_codon:yes gene_type:complete